MENQINAPAGTLPLSSHYGDPHTEYEALKKGAALVHGSDRTVLRLSGKDLVGMLDAILTNEVPKETNLGVYAALLNPKGRIQTDLRAVKSGEDVLILTEQAGAGAAREILGRYASFSRVEVSDLSEKEHWTIVGLYGPRASDFLGGLRLAEHETAWTEVGGAEALAVGVAVPIPGFDLVGREDALSIASVHLLQAGAVPVGLDACETARVEAGIPRFGPDITPENFLGETGILDRAVSFNKGCYPGQETVARMYYRGHPNKTLHRLVVEGTLPQPDTPIVQNGKQVGRITSIAPLPVNGQNLALGYLSRRMNPENALHAGDSTIKYLDQIC